MSDKGLFHCTVVTPERAVLDCDAEFVALPAWDGEVGILRHRAPLMVKLGIGVLRVTTAEATRKMAIDGGFAEMIDNELTVLTEHAYFAADLDRQEVEQSLTEALEMDAPDPGWMTKRQRQIDRAKAQLKIL
ncbi:MAG: ATP synthase F1 subunit epsilon [Thermoanaerobaculia bacterium]|nr:ATP synthase F1 subunit epsilon [Thermoanaerobaculia bacterium]